MKVNKKEIRELYSETLSLEDVRCILHISKRKAAWMLQNGIIKCEISQKKTKQYKVQIEELFAYLDKVKRDDPSVQIPIGLFNARKPSGKEKKERPRPILTRPKKPTKAFRAWLMDEWSNESEMLLTSDISRLTGYATQTVQQWMKKGNLRSVRARNKLMTTKEWLIDFYCDEAYKIIRMSDKHIELMNRFYERNKKK